MKNRILIIDDEQSIVELLRFNLELSDFDVDFVYDGVQGLKKIEEFHPDLILLDVMLPGVDGLTICQVLKKDENNKRIPIIMLTAKSQDTDKFFGFESGVDDYITKPFVVKELIYRVKAVLSRSQISEKNESAKMPEEICIKDLKINTSNYSITKENEKIDLTLKEFELLKYLLEHRGNVVSRDELLDKVWGYDFFGESRTLDVHIRNLRKKIVDEDQSVIETVRGIGYRIIN